MMPDRIGWKNQIWEVKPSNLPVSASKFEYGTLNFAAITAFQHSLDYLFDLGIHEIEKRILELSSYLWLKLDDLGVPLFTPVNTRSPIVSVLVNNAKEIGEKLMGDQIKITVRNGQPGHLRISPHFYNTKEDVDIFTTKLQEIL